jgi:glutamate-1-semialdehyde aminotransferase
MDGDNAEKVGGGQIFKEALELLPGGVNSPVRAFRSVGGQPIVFDRVSGAYCWDVDGNKVLSTTHLFKLFPHNLVGAKWEW